MSNQNQHRPGYKHTPLGWIPEEWEIKELSYCLAQGRHATYGIVQPGEYVNEGVLMVRSQDYAEGWTNVHNIMKVKFSMEEPYKRSRIAKNDLLLTVVGANLGKMAIVPEWLDNANISRAVARISIDTNKASSLFIYYQLQSGGVDKLIKLAMIGGAQPVLNLSELAKLRIVLPSLCNQRSIAAILSIWDEAITKTQQLIAQLQQRNKGLMHQLLTGKKRLKGFEGEWKEVHLGDVFTERNETGCINLDLLSIGSLGVYPQSQSEKRDISNTDKSKYKRICPGDIGYNTMRMWQGRSALSAMEGIVSPAYTIVTPKDQQHSEFYAYLFKLPSVVNKFFRNSQGLVEDTLNCKFKDLAIVKVKVPEYNEQVAIAEVIQKAVEEVKLYEQKLAALQQQKKGLMQKLLTGEVRVKV